MQFNSIDYMFFFPIVVLILFVLPRQLRCTWLLITSYYFYMCWNPKYAILILGSTVITFIAGLILGKITQKNNNIFYKKLCVASCIILNLAVLFIFKYYNFAIYSVNMFLEKMGADLEYASIDLLLPVGISFYTFQALGYIIDVYRGKIEPEYNFVRYALFISFFPQLVAGPIERSSNLLKQIDRINTYKLWNYERVRDGILLIFWGLFQKIVIADRISVLVNTVYGNYINYGFIEIALATILFAFQIYCDFGGYTNIARGSARVMGFELIKNFNQPYLAVNIKEFWKRWHVSLTTWFTDYIYIPLGGSRKGKRQQYINIFIVFSISGLWHGASWNYVAWGLLHATYQVLEDIYYSMKRKYWENKNTTDSMSSVLRKRISTFILVDFAWIFFASSSLSNAVNIIKQMFADISIGNIQKMGLESADWVILLIALVILYVVDFMHEKNISVFESIRKQELWFRGVLYLGLVWTIILFGVYGVGYDASQFIYFQF